MVVIIIIFGLFRGENILIIEMVLSVVVSFLNLFFVVIFKLGYREGCFFGEIFMVFLKRGVGGELEGIVSVF